MQDIGHGEDDVMILGGQQVFLLRFEPARLLEALALGAVAVATAVVRDSLVAAGVTFVDVTTPGCRPARRDVSDNARLLLAQSWEPIGIHSEDIGELQLGAARAALARWAVHASAVVFREAFQIGKKIERTLCVVQEVPGHVHVDLG
jgi:hypothetical protein